MLHPEVFRFTWKRTKPLTMSRLDYVLMPQQDLGFLRTCEIIPGFLSDHSFLELSLSFSNVVLGGGFWKFNTSLLREKAFIDEINKAIDLAELRYDDLSPSLKWEMMKKDFTEIAMWYSKNRSKQTKIKKDRLLKRKNSLEKKLTCINLKSVNGVSLIEKVNNKLDVINAELQIELDKDFQGAVLRSKAKWYELGEKNTKYFLSLEKHNAIRKSMSSIITDQGDKINNPKLILQEQKTFYERLYKTNPNVKFERNRPPPVQVSDEQKLKMNTDLSLEELGKALATTAYNKTPGPDGIPADFYKVFYIKIKHLLLKVFNEIFSVRKIFQSGREGIISLIPKKGRDSRYIKNWRPIILLCADYKSLVKVIANRIKGSLTNLIHPDQAGFVPGCNISENIRKVLDGINIIKKNSIEVALLLVDFEKAFDRVEYSSLLAAMSHFGFGEKS